jgi:arsenate reductase
LAEALVNHYASGRWQAFSAGTQPAGFVHPLAIRALEELGIHHSGESKAVEVFLGQDFDAVITVCDDAAENCPVWLGRGKRVHIGFSDPAMAKGSEEERLAEFRRVRNQIHEQVLDWLNAQDGPRFCEV